MSGNTDIHNDSPKEGWTDRFFRLCRESYLVRPDNRWIGGVCGAIARRMGWSTALVRALMLLAVFIFGAGAAFYGFAWFVLPDSHGSIIAEDILDGRWQGSLVGIIICWLLAAWALGIGVPSIIIAALVLYFFIRWSRQQAVSYFATAGPGDPGSWSYGDSGYGQGPQGFGPYGPTNPGHYGSAACRPGFYGFGFNGSEPNGYGPLGHNSGFYEPLHQNTNQQDLQPNGADPDGSSLDMTDPYSSGSSESGASFPNARGGEGNESFSGFREGAGAQSQWKGPDTYPDKIWDGSKNNGQSAYAYPPQRFPAPRPPRLRRRPAGPGLVCLMLGLIFVSGGTVWLLASNSDHGLIYALVWSASVAFVLGLVIVLLGCLGRRSGGLTPIGIISTIVVFVLACSCWSVYTGNLEYLLRDNLQNYTLIKVSGKDEGKILGSSRGDMRRYQEGLLLIGEPKSQGKVLIDLSEFEKNNGTHKVDMDNALSRISGCPTGTLNIALHFADAQIILPKGCTYSYEMTGYDLTWGRDSNQDNRISTVDEDLESDDGSSMPDSPELTILVRSLIRGQVTVHRKGTATLPEHRSVNSESKHMDYDHKSDQDQEGENDE